MESDSGRNSIGQMLAAIKDIVDGYGPLTEVRGGTLAGGAGLAALTLVFERGSVRIEAVGDDDTVRLTQGSSADGEPLSHLPPWPSAIGREAAWVWSLTNQQGYNDGVQLEFGKPVPEGQPPRVCVQITVAASTLWLSAVSDWI